jgi:hypothetical protein
VLSDDLPTLAGKHVKTKLITVLAAVAAVALATASSPAATRKVCGNTPSGTAIIAVGPTSCPFAKAVERKWRSRGTVKVAAGIYGGPNKTFRVYSTATKRRVTMHCREHIETDNIFGLCTGGDHARVEIRS